MIISIDTENTFVDKPLTQLRIKGEVVDWQRTALKEPQTEAVFTRDRPVLSGAFWGAD